MSETTRVTISTEKQNLSQIDIKPFSVNNDGILSNPKLVATSIKPDDKLILEYSSHPVLHGFIDAYRNHRPVTISPDIIWLLILQAFSNYVESISETLRPKFVNFEGQAEIIVDSRHKAYPYLTVDSWNEEFPKFTKQIKKYVGDEIVDILKPDFTTTTATTLSVGQLSIMSAFKNYFHYLHFFGVCEFPFVNVEGTIEDWQKIMTKLDYLVKYDFEFWLKRIRPIITKIIDTKKGNIDKEFWLNMIRIHQVPGPCDGEMSSINGWFINFFPFNDDLMYMDHELDMYSRVASELLSVPITIRIYDGDILLKEFPAEYVAGFVGMTQNKEDSSLKPEIGWFIYESDEVNQKREEYTKNKQKMLQIEQMRLKAINGFKK